MSRKSRNLLISVIALIVIGAAFIVVRNVGNDDIPMTMSPTVKTVVLSELATASLRSVMVENTDGGVHFYSSDGTDWQIADIPEHYRRDSTGAISAVRYLARIQGQEIEENADSTRLAEFGLENPVATVTLRDKDGNNTVIEFGTMNPSGTGRFARAAGSSAVALVAPHISRTALATPAMFRDMGLPTVNIQEMLGFSFRNSETLFIAEPKTQIDPFVINTGPFEVVAPYRGQYPMDDYSLGKILTETRPLPQMVRGWVDDADPTDPSIGLDDDADFLNLFDRSGGALSLRIGASDGNGNRYAMLTDREGPVFLLGESDLAILKTKPFELLSKFMFLATITEVTQVKVESGGDTFFMNRKEYGDPEDSKDDEFTINDLPVEHEQFTSTYQKFIGLLWEGEITERKTLEFPEVRITVTHKTPGIENVVLRFWPYDDTYYQATVGNNPVEFLIGRYQVNLFLEELKALSEYAS